MKGFILGLSLLSLNLSAGDTLYLQNETIKIADRSINQRDGVEFFKAVPDTKFYIVQFQGPIHDSSKQQMLQAGIEIGSYIPQDAFLTKIDSTEGWATLNGMSEIRNVVPYRARFKMSNDWMPLSVFSRSNPEKALVRLFSKEEYNAFANQLDSLNLKVVIGHVYGAIISVSGTRADIERIRDVDGVEWVEPYPTFETLVFKTESGVTTNAPGDYTDLTGYETGTKVMNADAAWARGFDGTGEIVGVGDTGLDKGSRGPLAQDFQGKIVAGYYLGAYARDWDDSMGHGTHVSGSVAGNGATSGGIIKGAGHNARLVPVSLWSPMLGGLSVPPDLAEVFVPPHVNNGASIHTNSWGSMNTKYDNFSSMADEVMWNYPELLLVFAAGNSGTDNNKDGRIDPTSVGSPGSAKNVMTVGASENLVAVGGKQETCGQLRPKNWGVEPIASSKLSDNPNGMACFSSVGPTPDGRIKPDVVAPGTNILSTQSQVQGANTLWGLYNKHYSFSGGTSMATPLAAGATAVTRQYLRASGITNPSSALLKGVMMHTAFDMFPGQYGTGPTQEIPVERPNSIEGYGRVDMDASTKIDVAGLFDERVGLKTAEEKTFTFDLEAGQKLMATMVYVDAAGSPSAAKALVNDLDLKIVGPNGQTSFPNHLSGPDSTNNAEHISLTAVDAGQYTVVVSARNVPTGMTGTGAQPYALIVTK